MQIQWTEDLSVNVKVIDDQHKHFVSLINSLYEAGENGTQSEKIEELLAQLEEYAEYHFATEEKYFEEFKFDGAEEHVAEHRKLTDRLKHLTEQYKAGHKSVAIETVFFLEDWLKAHLVKMDHKYVECFTEHGLV